MARKRGLTSIPTYTHMVPNAPRLVRVALPEPFGVTEKRQLWVPTEIEIVLRGQGPPDDFIDPNLQAFLQKFIAGYYVTGSMNGDLQKLKPDFERLQNLDEVWAMCFRAPKFNQWRLLGRFIAPDTFIGLGLYRRSFLDGEAKYHRHALDFIQHWTNVMTTAPVLKGQAIGDYISKPVGDPYAHVL
jgi:hypothetical protein